MALCLHTPICLHGVVKGTTSLLLLPKTMKSMYIVPVIPQFYDVTKAVCALMLKFTY